MRKLRWVCDDNGCYTEKVQARLGLFDECFHPEKDGSNFGFSDVDGVVEHNGHLLFLEWKTNGGVSGGQDITFGALIKHGHSVLIVSGDTAGDRVRGWFRSPGVETQQLEGLAAIRASIRAWFLRTF